MDTTWHIDLTNHRRLSMISFFKSRKNFWHLYNKLKCDLFVFNTIKDDNM